MFGENPHGGPGKLEALLFGSNQISNAGMVSFSEAIARGALGDLKTLRIDNPSEQLKANCSSKKIKLNY